MPKLKGMRFATAIIERYKRRETSVEEAMIEMYLAGVSTQEDRGRLRDPVGRERVGIDGVEPQRQGVRGRRGVEEQAARPRKYPYVFVDGIYLKRSWGGSFENVAVMVAIGVNDDGYREVIGAAEGFTESAECWREFLSWLKAPRAALACSMFTGDKAAAMIGRDSRGVPGRRLPALHGALLPQRAREGAQVQARPRRPRCSRPSMPMESLRGEHGAKAGRVAAKLEDNEAGGGRQVRPRRRTRRR